VWLCYACTVLFNLSARCVFLPEGLMLWKLVFTSYNHRYEDMFDFQVALAMFSCICSAKGLPLAQVRVNTRSQPACTRQGKQRNSGHEMRRTGITLSAQTEEGINIWCKRQADIWCEHQADLQRVWMHLTWYIHNQHFGLLYPWPCTCSPRAAGMQYWSQTELHAWLRCRQKR